MGQGYSQPIDADALLSNIHNRTFAVCDKHGLGRGDWQMTFQILDAQRQTVQVTEQAQSGLRRVHTATYTKTRECGLRQLPTNRLVVRLSDEQAPYSWMVEQLSDDVFELWVAGTGGAMNFQMNKLP